MGQWWSNFCLRGGNHFYFCWKWSSIGEKYFKLHHKDCEPLHLKTDLGWNGNPNAERSISRCRMKLLSRANVKQKRKISLLSCATSTALKSSERGAGEQKNFRSLLSLCRPASKWRRRSRRRRAKEEKFAGSPFRSWWERVRLIVISI